MDLRRFIPFFDPSVETWAIEARVLRWLTFTWLFIGLVVLFSASYHIGVAESGDGLFYFKRQLLWTAAGLAGFHLLVHTPLRRVLAIATPLFFVVLVLVFATQIPGVGTTVNGATRWISIGPFPLQPSELMKPLLLLQSALVFGQWQWLTVRVRFLWLGLFGAVLLGILIQPNLSTTALCGISLWLVALAAGLPYTRLLGAALGGVGMAVLSVSKNPYQLKRILSFLNPWADALGDGFQLSQSLMAVGSGGTLGTGYGFSVAKLSYLPIQHTDFIFSVYAEEFGLAGGVFLLLLLFAYGSVALRVALKLQNLVWRLIAVGSMVFMIGQALLNIGVATGVLPTTGLPLPLFSYGGSSMIASLLIAALLIRVAREGSEAEVIPLNPASDPSLVPDLGGSTGLGMLERLLAKSAVPGQEARAARSPSRRSPIARERGNQNQSLRRSPPTPSDPLRRSTPLSQSDRSPRSPAAESTWRGSFPASDRKRKPQRRRPRSTQ